jgi:pimeloyl-ACP methyl ester carboxylesterase
VGTRCLATHSPSDSRKHDVIIYPVNALHLAQNMPNAKLIVYPDANHGSWYENHEDFVFETNRFLNSE